MSATVRIAEMSWREVEEALHRDATVIIPMGSTEEHGPHAPTGDYLVTDVISERVAQLTNAIVAPPIPFSYSEYFRRFPGTITLSAETLRLLVLDIVGSLLDQGFRRVILFNGHKGNEPILQLVLREVRRERGLLIPAVAPASFGVTSALKQELYGVQHIGHGGEPMGSKQAYLRPGRVNLERSEDFGTQRFLGLEPTGLNGVNFDGNSVMLALNMEDISPPSGSLSDPRLASPVIGERLLDASVAALAAFVTWFSTIDPTVTP